MCYPLSHNWIIRNYVSQAVWMHQFYPLIWILNMQVGNQKLEIALLLHPVTLLSNKMCSCHLLCRCAASFYPLIWILNIQVGNKKLEIVVLLHPTTLWLNQMKFLPTDMNFASVLCSLSPTEKLRPFITNTQWLRPTCRFGHWTFGSAACLQQTEIVLWKKRDWTTNAPMS